MDVFSAGELINSSYCELKADFIEIISDNCAIRCYTDCKNYQTS